MSADLEIAALETRTQLLALQREWDELLIKSEVASPFLTPGWQLAWLDTYGASHRLYVLTARKEGALIGTWLLAWRRSKLFRVLEAIGAGRSDWLDVLAIPELRRDVITSFCRHLSRERKRWDLIDLRDVLAESPTLPILEECMQAGLIRVRHNPRTIAPYLALQGSFESYLASRSKKFRANLRQQQRKTRPGGSGPLVKCEVLTNPADSMDTLANIEQRSWKAREGIRKLTTTTGREFYRRFLSALDTSGAARVWTAVVNGETIAYIILFKYKGKCYYYNGAYVEDVAELGPGTLLHAAAIQQAFEEGLREYDFLSGEESYKDRWCTHRRSIQHVALFNPRLASVAAYKLHVALKWNLRSVKLLRAARAWVLAKSRQLVRQGFAWR